MDWKQYAIAAGFNTWPEIASAVIALALFVYFAANRLLTTRKRAALPSNQEAETNG